MRVPFSNGKKNIYQSQIIAQNFADENRQTKKMQKNTICERAPTIFNFWKKTKQNEWNHCLLTFHNL